MSESSGFSLATWMLPKPTADGAEQQNADKTPTPTEVAESSRGSPTELVDNTAFDYYFEQNTAYENEDGDDDDDLATDEAAAIAELMAQAAAQNVTMQVLMTNKRPRTEPESTEPAAPEEADLYVILSINTPLPNPLPQGFGLRPRILPRARDPPKAHSHIVTLIFGNKWT